MKKFKVSLPPLSMAHDEIIIRTVEVVADYHRVEAGVLTFRRHPRGNDQFPQAVRVFAPGFWAEVVDAGEEVYDRHESKPKNHVEQRMSALDYSNGDRDAL